MRLHVRAGRARSAVLGLAAAMVVAGACETARNPGGVQQDLIAPAITLSFTQDTQQIASGLSFSVTASDNLGLKDIRLTYSDPTIGTSDSVFTSTVTNYNQSVTVTFPPGSGAGGPITIIGRATDGAGNFTESTIVIFLSNVQALTVVLVTPSAGPPAPLASPGRNIVVAVHGQQVGGLQRVGFIVTPRSAVSDPTTPPTDSLIFIGTLPKDTTYTDTLTVSPSFTTGSFTVAGFAMDAGGRRVTTTPPVTVNILSVATDNTPPVVSHTIASRVEATDTITVRGIDPSAISWIGFRVDTVLNAAPPFTGITPLKFDSVNVGAANLTDVTQKLSLGLTTLTTFPKSVVVRGYACDLATARNCAYSQTSTVITGSAPRRAPLRAAAAGAGQDTVTVVAGTTHPLPFGGHIADAIYNSNRRELYLTNDVLGRVEVYNLATNTFDPNGIITAGPVPWGIALWPVDTAGTYDVNRVVVADAGGTELSILDASTRRLLWRQALPNFLIEKYSIQVVSQFTRAVITVHDVSDRPQYLGTVCRVTTGSPTGACASDSIYAIYSTTPTASSTSPFNGRATLRMEKLTPTTNPDSLFGHLFWELGDLGSNVAGDTLRIEMVRPSLGVSKVVLTACRAITIDFPSFGLGDQTFVRNTGNFTHAFVGEGGNVSTAFARVMGYSAKKLLNTPASSCTMTPTSILEPPPGITGSDDQDFGMSPGRHVSDFISNTGVHVVSIATNFNGLTNLVRAGTDSTYYLDEGLRLWGTSSVGSTTPGMDMNYNHKFEPGGSCSVTCGGGSGNLGERIVFAAAPDTSIRAFDTYFFNQQKKIAIRDPIIGPLRVALDASTSQQYLFGITARGLVVVSLPPITNINPQAPPRR